MGESSGYKEYVSGLLAGVSTVAVGHPFDTVKVMLQKHNTEANGVKYKNGLHCAARVLKTEGVKGLYRGATSSFVGMTFESSLVFGIYSQTKQLLQGGVQSGKPQPSAIIPSAAFGGAVISFILCPTELLKCRMQVQGIDSLVSYSSRYSSPLDCAIKTFKMEGVRFSKNSRSVFNEGGTHALNLTEFPSDYRPFSGWLCATFLRESLSNATFFTVYEYIRYYMHIQLKDASINQSHLTDVGTGILSGGLGGIACWCVVLPLDVAKTIIQTSPDKSSTRNPFQILTSIHRRSGLRGCYAGLGPTVVRAFPANAAAIVSWELAVKMLGIKRD